MKILETKNLSKSFGGIKAINNLNFFLNQNEVRGVIGPNGSGKSTFFNLLTGIYKADDGSSIFLNGENITNIETHQTVERDNRNHASKYSGVWLAGLCRG